MNRVMLTGNIARDAELRGNPETGSAVLRFPLAVNERRRDANGNWNDVASFFDCVIFGNRATALANYLKRGTKCGVDGSLRQESWERDGKKQYAVRVIVENFEFLGSRNDGSNNQGFQQNNTSGYTPMNDTQSSAPYSSENYSQPSFGAPAPGQQSAYQPQTNQSGFGGGTYSFGQSGTASSNDAAAPSPSSTSGESNSPIPF